MSPDDPTRSTKQLKRPESGLRHRLDKDPAARPLPTDGPPVTPRNRPELPSTELPLVHLPSLYKPERFLNASAARGARPAALKQIDDDLAAVERTLDPRERFERLRSLKKSVDEFVQRHTKDNDRRKLVSALKSWVDGAIGLREPLFDTTKTPHD
jgi:hypothetical protein